MITYGWKSVKKKSGPREEKSEKNDLEKRKEKRKENK